MIERGEEEDGKKQSFGTIDERKKVKSRENEILGFKSHGHNLLFRGTKLSSENPVILPWSLISRPYQEKRNDLPGEETGKEREKMKERMSGKKNGKIVTSVELFSSLFSILNSSSFT